MVRVIFSGWKLVLSLEFVFSAMMVVFVVSTRRMFVCFDVEVCDVQISREIVGD